MKLICFSCNDTSILSVYSKWLSHSFTFYGPIAFTLKKITEHIWFVTSTQKPEIFRKLRFDISQVWLTFTRTYFILFLLLSCCSNCLSVQLVILSRAWFFQQLSKTNLLILETVLGSWCLLNSHYSARKCF